MDFLFLIGVEPSMKRISNKFHISSQLERLSEVARTGVSLHCHSMYSMEMLDFIPFYAKKIPWIAGRYMKEEEKYAAREMRKIDFETAYWSPPLTPQQVFDSERQSIEACGLKSIVSITDHDEICGNFEVETNVPGDEMPISLEWTVPFQYGFFHLGIHNLPPDMADEIKKDLLEYTFNKELQNDTRLSELFCLLNELQGVLVILNHPIWDIEMIGQSRHEVLLRDFISIHRQWIHALEVNGFRNWSENQAVINLAHEINLPVVSGGDRHGCQANTVINVTNARTFDDFVCEIREEKRSQVAFLPEYNAPLVSRQLQSFSEILGYLPEAADDRRRWFDRVFFDMADGRGTVSLSNHGWERGGPPWLRFAVATLGLMGNPLIRPMFNLLRKREDVLPKSIDVQDNKLLTDVAVNTPRIGSKAVEPAI